MAKNGNKLITEKWNRKRIGGRCITEKSKRAPGPNSLGEKADDGLAQLLRFLHGEAGGAVELILVLVLVRVVRGRRRKEELVAEDVDGTRTSRHIRERNTNKVRAVVVVMLSRSFGLPEEGERIVLVVVIVLLGRKRGEDDDRTALRSEAEEAVLEDSRLDSCVRREVREESRKDVMRDVDLLVRRVLRSVRRVMRTIGEKLDGDFDVDLALDDILSGRGAIMEVVGEEGNGNDVVSDNILQHLLGEGDGGVEECDGFEGKLLEHVIRRCEDRELFELVFLDQLVDDPAEKGVDVERVVLRSVRELR